jgi:hypothetical protein
MANRYHSKRKEVIDALGAKCAKCGAENVPFHLDHIDRTKKKIRGNDVHSVNDAALKEEMKNLQLLCVPCHKTKTRESWDYGGTGPAKCGSYWKYKKYGCRCNDCVVAYKATTKLWREKRKEKLKELLSNNKK